MLTNIDITKIHPHPNNPRKDLGDLNELAESIKSKGILQNLTIVPMDTELYQKKISSKKAYTGDYTAVIGHRRLAAAKLADLSEVPCSISDMSEKEQLATMLLENMQRSDLTVIEQAQGFQMMLDLGETTQSIAKKTGFSETTVRKRLFVASLDVTKSKSALEGVQKKNIPLSIAAEYANAEDKEEKRAELSERYPKCESTINFLCCCNSDGEPRPDIQLVINSSKYLLDFIIENPIPFRVSNKCCDYCKKHVAHNAQKPFDMIITGERRDEGGMRSVPRKDNTSMCFTETADGKYRLRPLYYVSDADKQWYKDYYGIRYSDAYEVYGQRAQAVAGAPYRRKR